MTSEVDVFDIEL